MRRIPGATPANAEMLAGLHQDIVETCKTLLFRHHYFIIEEAVIRAGKRKMRHQIRWDWVVAELNEYFAPLKIAGHGRAFVRSLAEAEGDGKLPVLKEVLD